MNKTKAIVLYLHVHQPYRVRHYTIFDAGNHHNYFNSDDDSDENNEKLLHKVAEKSYLPMNKVLLDLLHKHPEFKVSLSITGTVLEQLEAWHPKALQSFKELVDSGRVEIVGETYHHSLAFFYSRSEFEMQVEMHKDKVQQLFGQTPKVFRNTEFAYNNDLAYWADKAGYNAILTEGWDANLGWRSPNFVYRPTYTDKIRLLLKNYKLSDDLAFRFGRKDWQEYPLTASKYCHWMSEDKEADVFNLFMDYETFGEHQWADTGIFEFVRKLPEEWLQSDGHTFKTVSEAVESFDPKDKIDIPETVTWADEERDLSAWLGNKMQQEAIKAVYELRTPVINSKDLQIIEDWRKLQTSDHFYYMCTKWFNDGDVHAYFSPYESPYIAFTNFMNAYHDIKYRLSEKGIEV